MRHLEFVMPNINLTEVTGLINDSGSSVTWSMLLRSISKESYLSRLVVVTCAYIATLVNLPGLSERNEGVLCPTTCSQTENGIIVDLKAENIANTCS